MGGEHDAAQRLVKVAGRVPQIFQLS
jgi:hypothetical protein